MIKTEGYIIEPDSNYDQRRRIPSGPASLIRREIEIPDPGDHEVHVKTLAVCWEGNMGHALDRRPIDLCLDRKEPWCLIGNSGVVQVLSCGKGVTQVEPGQTCLLFCNGNPDRWGYPQKIYAYDQPGSYGLLARETKVHELQLIPLPEKSPLTLQQWAAFALRGVTAYSNWRLALHTLRGLIFEDELPYINVGAWGGGVSVLQAQLAAKQGHKVFMMSSTPERLEVIRKSGVIPVNRKEFFPDLDYVKYQAARSENNQEYLQKYEQSRKSFREKIGELTDGNLVNIFIDYIGSPVLPPTLEVIAREGIICSAGWKEGMVLTQIRAIECINRVQRISTHYARRREGFAAAQLAVHGDIVPIVDEKQYTFDTVPDMAANYLAGKYVFFPVATFN
ncbi:MAG: zinc-binding dehydrogenase [Candidatus Tectomicrobia bacterium]|nr:zinc-binding dehydrogenase [Candidatus Tectomicrobia bacterium]